MIVDTSALAAIIFREPGVQPLLAALRSEPGIIITPVLVELRRVTALPRNQPSHAVDELLNELARGRIVIAPFSAAAADAAVLANAHYGSKGGLGGPLNMLDLMVYGAAKEAGLPILCIGKNFTMTDALIHPASRRE